MLPHKICHSPAVIKLDHWLDRPRDVRLIVILSDRTLHPDPTAVSLDIMSVQLCIDRLLLESLNRILLTGVRH